MKEKNYLKDFGADLHKHISNPPSETWSEIRQQLDKQDFDAKLKGRMEGLSQQPPPQAWTAVEKGLPRHLWLRKRLRQATAVAAVLLLGIFLHFSYQEWISAQDDSLPIAARHDSLCEPTTPRQANDFVYDLGENQSPKADAKRHLAIEDALLEALLVEEEDIVVAIDSALIASALKPAKQPEEKNLLAAAEDEIELQISIPLRVVEEDEIEAMLQLYEANKRKP